MRKLFSCVAVALVFASALAAPGNAFYFLDSAGVLGEETKSEIYAANQLLEEACGAQIAIVALEDISGASIEKYATGMRDLWGVGDIEKQNGFLLLITVANREYCAIAGRGLESVLPKDEIARLLDAYFVPDFMEGDCDAGVRKMFAAVFERIAEFYGLEAAMAEVPLENVSEDEVSSETSALPVALFAAAGFMAIWMLLRRRKFGMYRR